MKTPVTRLSSLVLVAAAALAAAAAVPSARPTKAARAEDAARAARLAAWSEGLRTNANPRTQAQFRDEVFLPFWRRQTVEPFLAGPEGREPWAPEAVRLMEREIFELWNTSLVPPCIDPAGLGDARDRSDLIEFVERVRTKDPFLLFLRMVAFWERHVRAQPNPLAWSDSHPSAPREERSALRRAISEQPGAELVRFLVGGARFHGRNVHVDAAGLKDAADLAAKWLAACRPAPEEARAARWLLAEIFSPRDPNGLVSASSAASVLADALERSNEDIDPWFRLVARGRGDLEKAAERLRWNRGGGASGDGDDAARKLFASARRNLEAAWEMRRDPVSAGLMIDVAAAADPDDAETWLARATEAEIDFHHAYEAYLSAVCRPDAPGGAARLRAFADACRDAGHDESAPGLWWVVAELRLAKLANRDQRDLFADAAFADRCERIADGVRDDPGQPRRIRAFAARLAATIALLRGDEAGAAARQRLRTPDATIVFDDPFFVRAADLETVLRGLVGPHSDALFRIEALRRAGDPEGVRREAERLLDPAAGLSPDETALAAWRADDARVALEWDSGAWIPVRFSANGVFANGWSGSGWFGTSRPVLSDAHWFAGDGWCAAPARPGRYNDVLRFSVPVPGALELRGTAEWDRTQRGCQSNLGFDLDPEGAPFFQDRLHEVFVDPDPKWGGTMLSLNGAYWGHQPKEAAQGKYVLRDLPGRFDFRIVWGDDALSVWLGDDPTPFVARRWGGAGSGGARDRRLTIDGRAVRLTRLEIRNPAGPAPADDARPPEPDLPPIDRPAESAAFADPCGILANARTNAAARTWSGFVRDSLAPLLRRELVEPFEAGPEASAPWADEARAFLGECVRLGWYDALSRRYEWEWEPAVRLVLGKGAADPALRWGCAMGLAAQGRGDEAREQVRALREAVAGDGGTPFLRYLAALADWRVDGRARDEAERLGVAWAKSLADRPQDSRAVLHLLRQDLDLARLAPLLEASGADPWLALVARGAAETAQAENAQWRKSGSPEDALEPGRRFGAARTAFEKALAIHPDCPEQAVELLRGWKNRLGEEESVEWLRRGLDAESDNADLLRLAKPFLVPADVRDRPECVRAALLAFGRALADLGRNDTQLGAFACELMLDGCRGPRGTPPVWDSDEDCRRIRAVWDAIRGTDAAAASLADVAQAAAGFCAKARNDPDPCFDPDRRFRFWISSGVSLRHWFDDDFLWATAGPRFDEVLRIERLVRAGDFRRVLELSDALFRSRPTTRSSARHERWEREWAFRTGTKAWVRTEYPTGAPRSIPFRVAGEPATWVRSSADARSETEALLSGTGGIDMTVESGTRGDLEVGGWIALATNAPPDSTGRLVLLRRAGERSDEGRFQIQARLILGPETIRVEIGSVYDGKDPATAERPTAGWPDGRIPFRVTWRNGVVSVYLGDERAPAAEGSRLPELATGDPDVSLDGDRVVVGALAVRAPLGAAPGEEQPEGAPPRFRTVLLPGGVPLELAWCPAGSFEEGFWELERQGWTGENPAPRRTAELTRGFWIARCETTRAQWRAAMGGDAPGDGAPDAPVAASWDEAAAFAERLAAVAPQEGLRWALPTETQWERAARAGREGPLYPVALGEAIAPADGAGPRPAGAARANPWGV
ncbi:MAG: SUMF1/EgtB/PvdO family nonheme iron enzyme, partial [Kiritimatiellae bacterium]|nr:SUMF1/EgtB/PvdO family nonheme iron enzyme [Kiritimatiellia bacterium]